RSPSAVSSKSTNNRAPISTTFSPSATSAASRNWPTVPRIRARLQPNAAPARNPCLMPVSFRVVYTDPEVAWTGVTEAQAKADGIDYEKGAFPWAASGRALGMDAADGQTKILFDKQSGRA